jgi:hypothetical protein
MIITKDWLMRHRTKRGAWTRYQILALGIGWPPSQGWVKRLVGCDITDENALRFESGSTMTADKCVTKGNDIDKRIIELEDWIARIGYENRICTKSILGNECLGCWCG